ncbi:14980_t:CDS:2 [Cetraspora pellucida]|uniref:14980_t:CDS:1 n=1 Tax=Cetraspora pellucida TaxID=1433469 RepID=A0A9N9IJY7_9GLOM|nr:14980_t:CDS:2 [Cetraspora pellucida]
MNNIEEWLQSIGIMPKLMAIMHDNAVSNIKFIQDLSNSLEQLGLYFDYRQQSIRCFIYILNLAIHSLLSIAGNELNKLQELIRSIQESRLHRKKLKTTCFIHNIKVIKPILDIVTHWNSILEMSKIELLVEVLQSFKDATTFMSASEYSTLMITVPFYYILIGVLENAKRKVNTPFWLIQGTLHETTTHSTIMSQIYQSVCMDHQNKLDTYLMMLCIDSNIDMNYPTLSKFARDCLPIPGTSIPSEQAFSISSDMIANKRNQLNEKIVRSAMCLRLW